MKKPRTNHSVPRIVTVATEIAAIQTALSKNHARQQTILAELSSLKGSANASLTKQMVLQRELDKLSAGPTVQP